MLAYFGAQLVAGVAVLVALSGYFAPRIRDAAALTQRVREAYILPASLLGFVLGGAAVWRLTRRLFAAHARADAYAALGVTRPRAKPRPSSSVTPTRRPGSKRSTKAAPSASTRWPRNWGTAPSQWSSASTPTWARCGTAPTL